MDTCRIFPRHSSRIQTNEINRLVDYRNIESRLDDNYTVHDILDILPPVVSYNGKTGYLFVGPLGIEYTSLNPDFKVNIVYCSSTIPSNDIYDCFIDVLKFLNKNNIK